MKAFDVVVSATSDRGSLVQRSMFLVNTDVVSERVLFRLEKSVEEEFCLFG